jgi:hypothetical protein
MANGFAPYLLKNLAALAANNYPGLKLTPAGMTGMLLRNSNIGETQLVNGNGHKKTIKFKYKVRQNPSLVQETDNCDIDFTPVYQEGQLDAPRVAKLGFHISAATVAQYMDEASNPQNIGNPAVRVIAEIADSIGHCANAIIGKIDQRLLGDVTWGINVTNGLNTAKTFNISKDATKYNLDSGFAMLLNDAFENEFSGPLLIVGSGLLNAHELVKMQNAITSAQNGIDLSRFAGYQFYPDLNAASSAKFGTNQIGVFAPGTIHLVQADEYQGFRQGKIANSINFQITLPVNLGNGEQALMTFDAKLKEVDCKTVLLNGYGEEVEYEEGYALILKKNYGLFQLPTSAYSASDRLTGVNGALRYVVTNECDTCDEE